MPTSTIPVSQYMSAPVYTIGVDETLFAVRELLSELDISCLAVVDNRDELVGVISRTDLLRVGRFESGAKQNSGLLTLPEVPLADVMTHDVITVAADDTVASACRLMVQRWIHRVFVMDGRQLVGVCSTRNIMRSVFARRVDKPISTVMSDHIFTVRSDQSITEATERLEKVRVSGMVVLEDGWPVGIFGQREALEARDRPGNTTVEAVMNPATVCMRERTPLFRAAEQAVAMHIRRIVVCREREMVGIVTGIDFARAVM